MRSSRSRPLAFLAALAIAATSGGGNLVLCSHDDGTAALESGSDLCCQGSADQRPSSPALGAAPEGSCPGCEDRILALDGRIEAPRGGLGRITVATTSSPCPDRVGRALRNERLETAVAARGAPPPRPLRV